MNITTETVVAWMESHNLPCYRIQIDNLQAIQNEIQAEAGRYGSECEFTQKSLRQIDVEIEEVNVAVQGSITNAGFQVISPII